MKNLVVRRIVAFIIDYLVIIIYAILLFGLTTLLTNEQVNFGPFMGQLIGLITLTLPVFLYFFLSEKSAVGATFGKRAMQIIVNAANPNINKRIFRRNLIKFLPWEIAHTGVHWIFFFSRAEKEPPIWVWILLILPQVIMIGYFISMVQTKGRSGVYDKFSNTSIQLKR